MMNDSNTPGSAQAALIILILSSVTATSAVSAAWPQWRGPNRDGLSTETGLLKQWPAGGPPLSWKASGLGAGYSSVAIADNRLITSGDRTGSSYVSALNLADGKPLWSVKLGQAGAPGWGGFAGPRSTPSVDGERVFALGQYGAMVCLETATGQELWRKDFGKDFGGPLPEWGYAESPLIDGNRVVVTPGGSRGALVALNKTTGDILWQSKEFTDDAHYSSLIVAEIAGVRQYIQLTAASVAGIAAADGKLLWKAKRKGETAVIPTPIYHDGFVYVTSGYGVGCNLFKIAAANGQFSATQVWANKTTVNQHGGVIRIGNHLYGHSDSKGWTCQDFTSGAMVWQEKSRLGKGSIAYADGHFYLRQEDGKGSIALIEATPSGYQEKGRFDPPERSDKNSWPHPVIAGGHLFIRDQDVLLCYDLRPR